MNRPRLLRAAGFALILAFPAMAQAQDDFARARAAASEQVRVELEEIYAQGEQKLAPPWRGLRVLENAAVFIRAETAPAGKRPVSIWIDRELPVPGYHEKEKPYVSVRERHVADCGARRLGLAEWVYYSGRYGTGAVVARDRNAQPEMSEPLPDSLEEQIHGIACPKPVPKPVPKPKKPAKPKTDADQASAPKEAAKESAKDSAKETGKAAARKPPKNAARETAKRPSRPAPAESRKTPLTRKKPAPEEGAGEATSTAGRR